MSNQGYIAPNITGPTEVIYIDEKLCIGCNACANICRTQTILPNPEKGDPPLLIYPDECWFCACCVEACPTGALQMRQPIGRRILFKRKDTGEVFRVGQKDSPAKSFFRPPYGELTEDETWKLWIALNRKERQTVAVLPRDVCGKIAAKFHWTDVPEKLVSLLKNIGFDSVYAHSASLPSGNGSPFIVIFSDENASAATCDMHLSSTDLISMIQRACVSMYTAVHIWDELPLSDYDEEPL